MSKKYQYLAFCVVFLAYAEVLITEVATRPANSSTISSRLTDVTKLTSIKQLFVESQASTVCLDIDRSGNIYVLNGRDSTILMYDNQFRFIKRISSMGKGPDDLLRPNDFALSSDNKLIVADTDNNRIQILSKVGKSVGFFRYRQPMSIESLSTGEIVVIGQLNSELIQIFSRDGKFIRNIGDLVATDAKDVLPSLHYALNKGKLWVDDKDNIYWVAKNLVPPLVRKYSREGRLLLEFSPSEKGLEGRIYSAKTQIQESIVQKQNRVVGILNGLMVDSKSGDIWIFPAIPEVHVYDTNGKFKWAMSLGTKEGDLIGAWDARVLNSNYFVIANAAAGCYLFKIPLLSPATKLSTKRRTT